MSAEKNEFEDFVKSVMEKAFRDAADKTEREKIMASYRDMRQVYLHMRESGFTMEEAFTFMVVAGRKPPEEDE